MVFDTGIISDLVSTNSDSNIAGCHTLAVTMQAKIEGGDPLTGPISEQPYCITVNEPKPEVFANVPPMFETEISFARMVEYG